MVSNIANWLIRRPDVRYETTKELLLEPRIIKQYLFSVLYLCSTRGRLLRRRNLQTFGVQAGADPLPPVTTIAIHTLHLYIAYYSLLCFNKNQN